MGRVLLIQLLKLRHYQWSWHRCRSKSCKRSSDESILWIPNQSGAKGVFQDMPDPRPKTLLLFTLFQRKSGSELTNRTRLIEKRIRLLPRCSRMGSKTLSWLAQDFGLFLPMFWIGSLQIPSQSVEKVRMGLGPYQCHFCCCFSSLTLSVTQALLALCPIDTLSVLNDRLSTLKDIIYK